MPYELGYFILGIIFHILIEITRYPFAKKCNYDCSKCKVNYDCMGGFCYFKRNKK